MLFTLRAAFRVLKVADVLERRAHMVDIPLALFPNYAKLQSGVGIEFAGGANHG